MIKRTIEISREPAHLAVRLDQLLVQPHDRPEGARASIPCEDLGVVVVDHPQTTYSHHALASLGEHGAVVVVCGRDHLPVSVLLPLASHSSVVHRHQLQLGLSLPRKKQLWKQLVQAKIRAQAANLDESDTTRAQLLALAEEVKSGDTSNREAQAARLYWSRWIPGFRRTTDADGPPPNNLLNYGYAIFRAVLARHIVAAGLLPALGVHHRHRANLFCLADDLLEPIRPIVDARVRALFRDHGRHHLDQPTKAGILSLLTVSASSGDLGSGPLLVAAQRLVESFVRCCEDRAAKLLIPIADGADRC